MDEQVNWPMRSLTAANRANTACLQSACSFMEWQQIRLNTTTCSPKDRGLHGCPIHFKQYVEARLTRSMLSTPSTVAARRETTTGFCCSRQPLSMLWNSTHRQHVKILPDRSSSGLLLPSSFTLFSSVESFSFLLFGDLFPSFSVPDRTAVKQGDS